MDMSDVSEGAQSLFESEAGLGSLPPSHSHGERAPAWAVWAS
jgi:hypothetical protein